MERNPLDPDAVLTNKIPHLIQMSPPLDSNMSHITNTFFTVTPHFFKIHINVSSHKKLSLTCEAV
jgi:hypothetical protein